MYEEKYRHNRKPFNRQSKGGDQHGNSEKEDNSIPHTPVQATPLQVVVYGNFERAFRTFKNLVQKERILSDFKEKQSFEKPSDKKRRKKNEAKRKLFEESFKREDKPRKPRNTSKKVLMEDEVNE
jgi:small subunit ribosomal protein S21